jgi:hypothetical protein
MAEISLDELDAQQRELMKLLEQMQFETDPRKIQALGNQLSARGAALETLTKRFERQELDKVGPPLHGRIEVVLTSAQRQRVRAETGVDLPSFFIDDATGAMNKAMPHMEPAQIEWSAKQEAIRQREEAATRRAFSARVEEVLAEIEARGGRSAQRLVDQLRADPTWAAFGPKR